VVGRCWRNVSPAPPDNFYDSEDTDVVQITKLVMQIHANYVLIIDEIKNQNFLMGGAGATYVIFMNFQLEIDSLRLGWCS